MFRKKLHDGLSSDDDSFSSASTSENETTSDARSDRVPSSTSGNSPLQILPKDIRSLADSADLQSLNDGRDEIFVPKPSRLSLTQKSKSKFSETILATAAFTAATEPVDIRNEVRWFEGELPTKSYEENDKTLLRNSHAESGIRQRRSSKDSISSTSTIESMTFESKHNESKNTPGLSEHEKKKRLGHYRSKSDQFRRFRPFGTTRHLSINAGGSSPKNVESISTSLPTNSDVAGLYIWPVSFNVCNYSLNHKCRAETRALIRGVHVYSYVHHIPDGFVLKSTLITTDFKKRQKKKI